MKKHFIKFEEWMITPATSPPISDDVCLQLLTAQPLQAASELKAEALLPVVAAVICPRSGVLCEGPVSCREGLPRKRITCVRYRASGHRAQNAVAKP